MLCLMASSSCLLRPRRQRGDRCHIGLRVGSIRIWVERISGPDCQVNSSISLLLEADPVEPQQVAPQIDARMQVDIHRIAAEGAQEETGSPDRQGFARAFQGEPRRPGPSPSAPEYRQRRRRPRSPLRARRSPPFHPRRCAGAGCVSATDAPRSALRSPAAARASDCSGRPENGSQSAPPAASAPADSALSRTPVSKARHTVPGNMK